MGHYAPSVFTLFFSLTHVTCMTLLHTVVIKHITSVTGGTLCHASGHLAIYHQCYEFKKLLFTLGRFLPCTPSCVFKVSLKPIVQPQSQQGFILIFKIQAPSDYSFESEQSTKDLYTVGSIQQLALASHGSLIFIENQFYRIFVLQKRYFYNTRFLQDSIPLRNNKREEKGVEKICALTKGLFFEE